MQVGALEVIPVNDGFMTAAVRFSKPLPPAAASEPHCGMFTPDGRISCRIGAFVVHSGDRVLLIDAGAGHARVCCGSKDRAGELSRLLRQTGNDDAQVAATLANYDRIELATGTLPDDLARAGIRPDQITDVVFTHLHFDHVGWATRDGRPFFPNATYHAPRADLDHFNGSSLHERITAQIFGRPVVAETLGPVFDRLEPWDADKTIAPGVLVRLVPGHTPGNSVVVLHSQDQRAMLLGDVVHCPLELMDADFNLLGDFDQALANRVREAFARELEGTDTLITAPHFPGAHFGLLLAGKGMREWRVA